MIVKADQACCHNNDNEEHVNGRGDGLLVEEIGNNQEVSEVGANVIITFAVTLE